MFQIIDYFDIGYHSIVIYNNLYYKVIKPILNLKIVF